MRIDRVDVDGYRSLAGGFQFPARGLGLWACPNEGGKSALSRAICAALYGAPALANGAAAERSSRVVLRLTRDDGQALTITRDLNTGTVQVTDAGGNDVTAEYHDPDSGVEPGEKLLGFTRSQFETTALLRFDDLRDTIGNRALKMLLDHGRGRRPEPMPGSAPEGSASTSPDPASPESASPGGDLHIIHSGSDELAYVTGLDPEEQPEREPLEDPDEPGITAVDRLRRLKAHLAAFESEMEAKQSELQTRSSQLDEIRSEADRLSMLTGAEPQDVEKLGQLLDVIRRTDKRRDKIRIEERKYRRSLEGREDSAERLEELEGMFGRLDPSDEKFLETFRKGEMIRRGNLTIVRSESRLDESKIEEIVRARRDAARMAGVPLVFSILGLFASLAFRMFPVLPFSPQVFLGVGLAGAAAGAFLLYRARSLREEERLLLVETSERKRAQLDEIEREDREESERLRELMAERGIETVERILDLYEEWTDHEEEFHKLGKFAKRVEEVDRELAVIREKLGSFTALGGEESGRDPADVGLDELEAIHRDYTRFFEIQEEVRDAEMRVTQVETELAITEEEMAPVRDRLHSMLTEAGIEVDRDFDEAVELFKLRVEDGDVSDDAGREERPRRIEEPESSPPELPEWSPAISARMEAILRRFLPEVRDVEVDASLIPSLRMDARGPRLVPRDLEQRLSSGSLDQLCLALRLAIVETLSSSGERAPLLLDDPLLRSDDSRHDRALDFLVGDACERNQIVLMTAQEVRSRWFLHQFPRHQGRIAMIVGNAPGTSSPSSSPSVSSPS